MWLSLAVIVFLALALAACGSEKPKTLEERAQSIDELLICPVCPAETIDQAQVPLARDMRGFVREKLEEGWSKQQILDYFSAEERYGPAVLAEPPKSGANLTIWIVPPVGVAAGGALVLFTIRAMLRRRDEAGEGQMSEAGLEEYLVRVDAEMAWVDPVVEAVGEGPMYRETGSEAGNEEVNQTREEGGPTVG